MKKKINFQLIVIAVIAVITTTIGITYIYYSLFQKQVQKDLRISAEILTDSGYFENNSMNVEDINFSTNLEELRITWIDKDGTVLYDNDNSAELLGNHLSRPEVSEAFETGKGEIVRKSDTMNMNTFYYAILLKNGTVVRVATQARSIISVFATATPLVLLILLVIMIICVVLAHILTKQLLKPIEVTAQNLEDLSQEPKYKELVPFVNMIRKQHADILSSAKIRQDFTANVSHELKTPLTAISGYAELIQNHMVPKEREEHFVTEIKKNAERLLSLINDIIRLSELDHSANDPSFEELDLCNVVEECIETLKVNAAKRKVTLTFSGHRSTIRANREMIKELTDNLVQNAIRYNNENGKVEVKVFEKAGRAILSVEDNGIGIPKEDQERVFERFYRVDKSRSKATGGTGLGLAIVKHIVEIHGARILLQSQVNEGTLIQVEF